MYEKPTIKSKTIVAIAFNILLAIMLLLSGKSVKETEITMDNLGKIMEEQTSRNDETAIGIGLLGGSAIALKGRYDVDKRLKEAKDEKK